MGVIGLLTDVANFILLKPYREASNKQNDVANKLLVINKNVDRETT